MKEKMLLFLSTCFNYFLRGKKETYISSNILIIPFYIIQYYSSTIVEFILFVFLMQLIIIPISLTNVRLSKVIVYSKLFKIVSMSLLDINMYKNLDYDEIKDKEIISQDFKNEFIQGLIKCKYKNIKMTTHKWVIENIIKSEAITNIYDIELVQKKKEYLIFDILILSRKYTKSAYVKRQIYKVKLKKKS